MSPQTNQREIKDAFPSVHDHRATDLFYDIGYLSVTESIFIKHYNNRGAEEKLTRDSEKLYDLLGVNGFSILMSFPNEIPLNE